MYNVRYSESTPRPTLDIQATLDRLARVEVFPQTAAIARV